MGFEPTVPLTGHNGFRDRPDRPLWHLSVLRSCSVIRRRGDYLNQRPAAIAARSRGEKSPGKAHGHPNVKRQSNSDEAKTLPSIMQRQEIDGCGADFLDGAYETDSETSLRHPKVQLSANEKGRLNQLRKLMARASQRCSVSCATAGLTIGGRYFPDAPVPTANRQSSTGEPVGSRRNRATIRPAQA